MDKIIPLIESSQKVTFGDFLKELHQIVDILKSFDGLIDKASLKNQITHLEDLMASKEQANREMHERLNVLIATIYQHQMRESDLLKEIDRLHVELRSFEEFKRLLKGVKDYDAR